MAVVCSFAAIAAVFHIGSHAFKVSPNKIILPFLPNGSATSTSPLRSTPIGSARLHLGFVHCCCCSLSLRCRSGSCVAVFLISAPASVVFSASILAFICIQAVWAYFASCRLRPLCCPSCSVPSTAGPEFGFPVSSDDSSNFILGSSELMSIAGRLSPLVKPPLVEVLSSRFHAPVSPLELSLGDLLDGVPGEVVCYTAPCHAFIVCDAWVCASCQEAR